VDADSEAPEIQGLIYMSDATLSAHSLGHIYLRASDIDYLGDKELHRVNKCITSQITDFEQAIHLSADFGQVETYLSLWQMAHSTWMNSSGISLPQMLSSQ
jgi:hypothetical protein